MFFCWTIIAGELLRTLTTFNCSTENTVPVVISVAIVFVSPVIVKLRTVKSRIFKSPMISRLWLYILLTINLLLALGSSLIISVFKSVILLEIILLVYTT